MDSFFLILSGGFINRAAFSQTNYERLLYALFAILCLLIALRTIKRRQFDCAVVQGPAVLHGAGRQTVVQLGESLVLTSKTKITVRKVK